MERGTEYATVLHGPIAAACVAAFAAGCELIGPMACTTSVEPAIEVAVYDAVTGAPAAAGATGWVRDGEYVDSLRPSRYNGSGDLLAFRAADERPGRYDVVVEKDGYEVWQRARVRVRDGDCHVETVTPRADLVPVQ